MMSPQSQLVGGGSRFQMEQASLSLCNYILLRVGTSQPELRKWCLGSVAKITVFF